MLIRFAKHTGGMELAHQFIHKLREFGQEAYIVYVDGEHISSDQSITKEYQKYNIKATNEVEDSSENFLMMPEVFFNFVREYRNINIGCWWMSVDNRYYHGGFYDNFFFAKSIIGKLSAIKNFIKYKKNISDKELVIIDDRVCHFYQSVYAQIHLIKKGFKKILPMGDYINQSFFQSSNEDIITKENIVLYNPVKGLNFTKRIIKANPDIQFIPLKNLDRRELVILMEKAKLYIDFGHFPGKDRLSREAALNNAIIITGKNGASAFYEDVSIPSKYKIDSTKNNIKQISKLIRESLSNYESLNKDFDLYRSRIKMEEEEFNQQIIKTFFIL